MGATTNYMKLRNRSNGQTMSISYYCAGGDAAGYVCPVQIAGAATTGSNKVFILPPGQWDIVDVTGPATGTIRVMDNGMPSKVAIELASTIAMRGANFTHGTIPGGANLSLQVEVALAA